MKTTLILSTSLVLILGVVLSTWSFAAPIYIDPRNAPYNAACNASTDDQTALSSALAAAIAAKVSLYVPGICVFSGTLTVSGPVTVFGAGTEISALAAKSANQGMISVTTTASVIFRDLAISSTVPKTGGFGIKFEPANSDQNNNSIIENVRFQFQWSGLLFQKAAYWTVRNSRFTDIPEYAISIVVRNTASPDSGDSLIDNVLFAGGSTQTHISYQSSGGLKIKSCKFLRGLSAVDANLQASSGILMIQGNSCDQPAGSCFSITTAPGVDFNQILISDNHLLGQPSNALIYWNQSSGTTGRGVISGNFLNQLGGTNNMINIASAGNGNVLVATNTLVGLPNGGVGINIGANCVDCMVGLNLLEGVSLSNASATTPHINMQVGTSPSIAFRVTPDLMLLLAKGVVVPDALSLNVVNQDNSANRKAEIRATYTQWTAGGHN